MDPPSKRQRLETPLSVVDHVETIVREIATTLHPSTVELYRRLRSAFQVTTPRRDVTCLWIAIKFEEVHYSTLHSFVGLFDGAFTTDALVREEEEVLYELEYRIPFRNLYVDRLLGSVPRNGLSDRCASILAYSSRYLTPVSVPVWTAHVTEAHRTGKVAPALQTVTLETYPTDTDLRARGSRTSLQKPKASRRRKCVAYARESAFDGSATVGSRCRRTPLRQGRRSSPTWLSRTRGFSELVGQVHKGDVHVPEESPDQVAHRQGVRVPPSFVGVDGPNESHHARHRTRPTEWRYTVWMRVAAMRR